jgi:hypothetical protein
VLLAEYLPGVESPVRRLQRPRLLQRIDYVVADPHEFERLVHAHPDHMVERVLDPSLERTASSIVLSGGTEAFPHDTVRSDVGCGRGQRHLRHESRNGHREGVADEARQPLVVLVLERRLAGFDQLELRRHELGLAPPSQVAAHQRVEIVLERADLVGRHSLGSVAKASGEEPAR